MFKKQNIQVGDEVWYWAGNEKMEGEVLKIEKVGEDRYAIIEGEDVFLFYTLINLRNLKKIKPPLWQQLKKNREASSHKKKVKKQEIKNES